MNLFQSPDTIRLLQDLLKDPNIPSSESDDDDDVRPLGSSKINPGRTGPGAIGPKTSNRAKQKYPVKSTDAEKAPLLDNKERKSGMIEDPFTEVEDWLQQQEKEDGLLLEDRKRPEYTVSYKQAVGTEDLFLQMNNKTAATMSCEDMVIEIKMPEEKVDIEAMNLTVTEDDIDLQTPVYRLKLPLPQKIDPDKGKAKFDTDAKLLTLTLRMNRELDFVNF